MHRLSTRLTHPFLWRLPWPLTLPRPLSWPLLRLLFFWLTFWLPGVTGLTALAKTRNNDASGDRGSSNKKTGTQSDQKSGADLDLDSDDNGKDGKDTDDDQKPRDPTAHILDLRALWSQTQRTYPGMEASRQAVRVAQYTLNEQRWLNLPGGEFNYFLTGSPSVSCTTSNPALTGTGGTPLSAQQACLGTTAVDLTHGPIDQILPVHGVLMQASLRIVQPVFTFGKISTAIKLGRVGLEIAKAGADANEADLAVNVVRAYYGLKAARAALDTIQDGRDQIEKWIKRMDRDLERGKGGSTEIDLMRLKVAQSAIVLGAVDVERTARSALAALRFLAQDPHADIDEGDLVAEPIEPHEVSYYLEMALAHRPELRQLDATGEGARLYRRLRIADLFPDFAVAGTLSYGLATGIQDPLNGFMNRFNYLGFGLGLGAKWQLDFGPRVARLQKAHADVLQYDAKRREALGAGALEIERTYNDLTEATQRLKAAETAERRARGWLQGVKQNIDVGTAESRDMIDALRAYFDQHLQVLRSINDINVTAALLRRQCGLPVIY